MTPRPSAPAALRERGRVFSAGSGMRCIPPSSVPRQRGTTCGPASSRRSGPLTQKLRHPGGRIHERRSDFRRRRRLPLACAGRTRRTQDPVDAAGALGHHAGKLLRDSPRTRHPHGHADQPESAGRRHGPRKTQRSLRTRPPALGTVRRLAESHRPAGLRHIPFQRRSPRHGKNHGTHAAYRGHERDFPSAYPARFHSHRHCFRRAARLAARPHAHRTGLSRLRHAELLAGHAAHALFRHRPRLAASPASPRWTTPSSPPSARLWT